jgi:hypothetical protein
VDSVGAAILDRVARKKPSNIVVELGDFLSREIPPRSALLGPTILSQSLMMVHSWRGVGKTHFCLNIGYALASGGQFLKWRAPEPRKVLLVDGEMPAPTLQERLAYIVRAAQTPAPPGYFRLMTPDFQEGSMPDLATLEGQEAVDLAVQDDTALIIVDNLSCLMRRGGGENEAESWLSVSEWALRHRAAGRSILFVHHSGKNGAQRGTSKREDLLDLVLVLKHPTDYDPAEGARFEVRFEKARGFLGDDVAPFEAALGADARGNLLWTTRPLDDTTQDRVADLLGLGLSQSEIARELSINKSTVSRAVKRIEELRQKTPGTRNTQLC